MPKPNLYYGWIIVVLAFLSITTYGLFNSYGVFIGPLEAYLHSTRAAISATYTIYMVVYCLCAIPTGSFSDRYGPRKTLFAAAILIGCGIALCSTITSIWQLYLFFGVIAALGHSAIYVVPVSTVSRWFIRRRGLAVGMAACGLGVGLLLVPPLATQVIGTHGWRTAFIVLGITFFVINMLVAFFIRGRPEDKGLRPLEYGGQNVNTQEHSSPATEDFSVINALKTRGFWLLYLISLFCFGAAQMILVHIVPYSGSIGISSTAASLGLSSLGIGTIFGRAGPGALSDKIGRIPALVMVCCVEAIAILCLLAIKSPTALYFTMFFLGFGYGGMVVLCSAALGDFFGLKNTGALIGVWFTSGVPAGILGPLIAGMVFDSTGSYLWAFITAGILCMVAAISAALIKPVKKT